MSEVGICPTGACFNSRTVATHCGLCAACFAALSPSRREDLIAAEKSMNPPPEVVHVFVWSIVGGSLGSAVGNLLSNLVRSWL